jgi:Tfp pilus assembly protein PilZ
MRARYRSIGSNLGSYTPSARQHANLSGREPRNGTALTGVGTNGTLEISLLKHTVTSQPPPTLRIPFVRRCSVTSSGRNTEAMLLDLSLRGIYIATQKLPIVGETIEVSFRVPGNEREMTIPSEVAWIQTHQTHPVHGLPVGFGARFKKLAAEDVRVIARAIQTYCRSNPIYRQYL